MDRLTFQSLPFTVTRYDVQSQLASEKEVLVQEACWLIKCSFQWEAAKRVATLLAKDGGNGANKRSAPCAWWKVRQQGALS